MTGRRVAGTTNHAVDCARATLSTTALDLAVPARPRSGDHRRTNPDDQGSPADRCGRSPRRHLPGACPRTTWPPPAPSCTPAAPAARRTTPLRCRGWAGRRRSGDEARPTRSPGIAEAFVNLLRHEVIPPVPGFRVVRLVPPPEARGERPVEDEDVSSVVVGERVVVTWVRQVQDADHEAPRTLAHLDAVDYFEVPETHGMLLWTAPSGREVPVAWATKYLPRARDGWDWCLELAQRALGVTATGRSSRIRLVGERLPGDGWAARRRSCTWPWPRRRRSCRSRPLWHRRT